jgi:hypothetical protein
MRCSTDFNYSPLSELLLITATAGVAFLVALGPRAVVLVAVGAASGTR